MCFGCLTSSSTSLTCLQSAETSKMSFASETLQRSQAPVPLEVYPPHPSDEYDALRTGTPRSLRLKCVHLWLFFMWFASCSSNLSLHVRSRMAVELLDLLEMMQEEFQSWRQMPSPPLTPPSSCPPTPGTSSSSHPSPVPSPTSTDVTSVESSRKRKRSPPEAAQSRNTPLIVLEADHPSSLPLAPSKRRQQMAGRSSRPKQQLCQDATIATSPAVPYIARDRHE